MQSRSPRAQSRRRPSGSRGKRKAESSDLQQKVNAFIEKEGAWTAHDITLAPGVQTLGADVHDSRLRRIVQVVADTARKPLGELRVLDLGCLEGQFGIEFALHGAEVVALDARETNLRKTRFAAKALGAKTLDLRKMDVRGLELARLGNFDVVLCLGVLYHLDAPDVMELVRSMSALCSGIAVIDTHVSLEPRISFDWDGNRYWGASWTEYAPGTRAGNETAALWSSVGNDRSFLMTRPSLCNLLRHAGFTSVYECLNPYESHSPNWPRASTSGEWAEWRDRMTFVAVKGSRAHLLTSALTDTTLEPDRPERPRYLQPIISPGNLALNRAKRLVSAAARRFLRRA
jgi:SAM-dependent methyltransferase